MHKRGYFFRLRHSQTARQQQQKAISFHNIMKIIFIYKPDRLSGSGFLLTENIFTISSLVLHFVEESRRSFSSKLSKSRDDLDQLSIHLIGHAHLKPIPNSIRLSCYQAESCSSQKFSCSIISFFYTVLLKLIWLAEQRCLKMVTLH